MSRLNYILIISIILVVIFLGGGYFIWLPKYQNFKYQKNVLVQFQKNIQKKEKYYSNLKNIQKTIKSHQEEINKINDSLPENISLPILFDFMNKITAKNGLVLDNISASSGESNENSIQNTRRTNTTMIKSELTNKMNEENISNNISSSLSLQTLSISLSVTGSYSNFKKFLQAIYKNAKIIEVKSISFSSPQESDLFSINLSLETYFAKNFGDATSDELLGKQEIENN